MADATRPLLHRTRTDLLRWTALLIVGLTLASSGGAFGAEVGSHVGTPEGGAQVVPFHAASNDQPLCLSCALDSGAGEYPLVATPLSHATPSVLPTFVSASSSPRLEGSSGPSVVTSSSGWNGIDGSTGGGWTPPDTVGAASSSQFAEFVNLYWEVYSRSGAVLQTETAATFFGTTDSLSDPQVLYDPASGHWFVSLIDISSKTITIQVSQTSDATGSWWQYAGYSPGGSLFPDQPVMGFNTNTFIISSNIFQGNTFKHSEAWVLNKTQMMSGTTPSSATFTNGLGSAHPITDYGPLNTMYLVSDGFGRAGSLGLIAVTGTPPGGVSTSQQNPGIAPAEKAVANPSDAGGGSVNVDDGRIGSAAYQNGIIWATANDGCAVSTCARLFKITAATHTITQDFDWYPSAGVSAFYPAASFDSLGDLGILVSVVSSTTYASVDITGQLLSDPSGTLETPVMVATGTSAQTTTRFGDYSGLQPDPGTVSGFCGSGEWDGPAGGGSWNTWNECFNVTATAPTPKVSFVLSPTSGAGSVQFNGNTYYNGQTVTIAAGTYSLGQTTNAGWHFSSWTTSGGLTVGAGTLAVASSGTLTATYVQYPMVSFTVSPIGCQPITFNTTTWNSGTSGSFYASGSPFTASIAACAGYTFSTWSSTGGVALGTPGALSTSVTLTDNGTLSATFTGTTYAIGVVISPGAGSGYAKIGGTPYFNGNTANLAAGSYTLAFVASPGWAFSTWSATGGAAIGAGTLTVSGAGTLTESFAQHPLVSFTVSPVGCQPITFNTTTWNSGTSGNFYTSGSPFTASIPACAGYTFSTWSATGGIALGTPGALSTSVTLTDNGTLTATFAAATPTVSFTISPGAGAGIITVGGTNYYNGNSASLTSGTYTLAMIATAGWHFSAWSTTGGVSVGPSGLSVTASGTLTATFVGYPWVSFSAVGYTGCGPVVFNGTSQTTGGGNFYTSLSPYTASVAHCAGAVFSTWAPTGGVSVATPSAQSTSVTLTDNGTLTAGFVPESYNVNLHITPAAAPTGGTISLNGATYYDGQVATLTAGFYPISYIASPNFLFANWSTAGFVSFAGADLNVLGNGSVYITFVQAYTTTFYLTPSACAAIASINFMGIAFTSGGGGVFQSLTSSATASGCTGYAFSTWSTTGGASVSSATLNPTMLTAAGNGTLTASYSQNSTTTYAITLDATPASCGPITFNAVSYASGSTVNVAASSYGISVSACSGYTFAGWTSSTSSNTLLSPGALSTTATVGAAGTLTATFTPVGTTYSITLVASPGTCGPIVFNGTSYASGSVATVSGGTWPLVANACSGYTFAGWTATSPNVVTSPGASSTSATISGSGTITALYTAVVTTYSVTISTAPSTCGSVTLGTTTYTNGQTANLRAGNYAVAVASCTGYLPAPSFQVGGGVSLNALDTQLTVSGDGSLSLNFVELLSAKLTAGATNTTTGTVDPFTVSLTGGRAPYTVIWDFADGTPWVHANLTSTSGVQPHAFSSASVYPVAVLVADSSGQVVLAMVQVTVASSGPSPSSSPLGSLGGLLLLLIILALVAVIFGVGMAQRRRHRAEVQGAEAGAGAMAASGLSEPAPSPPPSEAPPPPPPSSDEVPPPPPADEIPPPPPDDTPPPPPSETGEGDSSEPASEAPEEGSTGDGEATDAPTEPEPAEDTGEGAPSSSAPDVSAPSSEEGPTDASLPSDPSPDAGDEGPSSPPSAEPSSSPPEEASDEVHVETDAPDI